MLTKEGVAVIQDIMDKYGVEHLANPRGHRDSNNHKLAALQDTYEKIIDEECIILQMLEEAYYVGPCPTDCVSKSGDKYILYNISLHICENFCPGSNSVPDEENHGGFFYYMPGGNIDKVLTGKIPGDIVKVAGYEYRIILSYSD